MEVRDGHTHVRATTRPFLVGRLADRFWLRFMFGNDGKLHFVLCQELKEESVLVVADVTATVIAEDPEAGHFVAKCHVVMGPRHSLCRG